MPNRFYEFLNHGFNNMIKNALRESALNEKKQEISPEDKRDNDLIRSAMRKRATGRSNAKFTKEEQDALDRNGWEATERVFKTANGHVAFGDPKSAKHGWEEMPQQASNYSRDDGYTLGHEFNPIKNKVRVKTDDGKIKWVDKPSKVNLADMGRKQRERAKNSPYEDSIFAERRGIKLRKGQKMPNSDSWFAEKENYFNNRKRAEDQAINSKLRQKHFELTEPVRETNSKIENSRHAINRYYSNADRDRADALERISYYKNVLNNIDNDLDAKVGVQQDFIDRATASKNDYMNKARERFANRHNKNESYRRRKHGKRFI